MGRAIIFHRDRDHLAVRFESQAPGAWESDTWPVMRARRVRIAWWRIYQGDPRDRRILGSGATLRQAVEVALNHWKSGG